MRFVDVTLRDGLQMEAAVIALDKKIELFNRLKECAFHRIEITSFVNPKWVPQFADSDEFCQSIFQTPLGVETMAFVPNAKGIERLVKFPIPWAAAFVAVSESFNKKNVNHSIAESLTSLKEVIATARQHQRKVRVYVSTVFGCPYEKKIHLEEAMSVIEKVVALNPDEIALSDTIGVALPAEVSAVLMETKKLIAPSKIAMHFHNTYGLGLVNILTARECGIDLFDGSVGGIGGCPYAKGATGNMPIEDVGYACSRITNTKMAWKGYARVLECLREKLNLQIHSHVGEVLEKGGTLYGYD